MYTEIDKLDVDEIVEREKRQTPDLEEGITPDVDFNVEEALSTYLKDNTSLGFHCVREFE